MRRMHKLVTLHVEVQCELLHLAQHQQIRRVMYRSSLLHYLDQLCTSQSHLYLRRGASRFMNDCETLNIFGRHTSHGARVRDDSARRPRRFGILSDYGSLVSNMRPQDCEAAWAWDENPTR